MASAGLGDSEGSSACRAGEVAARAKPKERCGQPALARQISFNLEESSGLVSNPTNQDRIADVSLEVSGKSETNSLWYSLYGIRGGCLPEPLRCVQIG